VPVTPKEILKRFSHVVTLRPGLSEEQIALFQAQLPGPLPLEVKELLAYSAGFETGSSPLVNSSRSKRNSAGTVLFKGNGAVGMEFLPCAVDLLGDGCGNFWVVDVNPNGAWGSIIFVCHDPPVIAIQAEDIASFLFQILEPEQSEPREALKYVHQQAVTRIWREEPWLVPALDARLSQDETIRKCANQLSDSFCVADLRSRKIGSGFSWGKAGPDAAVRRNGSELLFGVQQKTPGLLNRLFSRR
jgi:cell wall assembly regulator SMI1